MVTKLGRPVQKVMEVRLRSLTYVAGRSVPRASALFVGSAFRQRWALCLAALGGSRVQRSGSLLPPSRSRNLRWILQTEPCRPCVAWSPDLSGFGSAGTEGATFAASEACLRHEERRALCQALHADGRLRPSSASGTDGPCVRRCWTGTRPLRKGLAPFACEWVLEVPDLRRSWVVCSPDVACGWSRPCACRRLHGSKKKAGRGLLRLAGPFGPRVTSRAA